MKFHILTLSLFFGISPLLSSDYLTVEQQNEEMSRAFNKKETINPEQKAINSQLFQLAEQIFPHSASNGPSSVVTLDDWEKTKKYATETMFHRLNDTLSFILTNRKIILSALLKNPEFIGLTCYTIGQNAEDELFFDFPLLAASHPVANLAQSYLILKEYQYWIDILLLLKNTAFPNHTLSSYNHNAAVAIKDLIQSQMSTLEEKINAQSRNPINLSQLIDQTDNHDISFFVKADHSFHALLKSCLKSIDDALPRGTITQLNLRTAPLKKKAHIVGLGKYKRESVLENLSPKIGNLHAYFSKNYTAILTGIRSMAVMEHVTDNFIQQEIAELMRSPFYAAAHSRYIQLLEENLDYDKLFNGLTNNMISVQQIRKDLGLPKEIFMGLDFEKEMQKALKGYQSAKQEVPIEQLQNQETEKKAKTDVEIKTEADHRNSITKETHIQPKSKQKRIQNLE